MEKFLQKAKKNASILSTINGEKKKKVLYDMADELERYIDIIYKLYTNIYNLY